MSLETWTRQNFTRTVALSEFVHDGVTLLLNHVTVHSRDSEIGLAHLLGKPVDLPARVAEDDGLRDGKGVVQVAEGIELPVLFLDSDKELLNAFEGQLVTLDQNANRVLR